jgi:hypothetical protein
VSTFNEGCRIPWFLFPKFIAYKDVATEDVDDDILSHLLNSFVSIGRVIFSCCIDIVGSAT